jgi:hypothetical protein
LDDNTICYSCNPNTFLLVDKCVTASECPNGTYPDTDTWKCEECNYYCSVCFDDSLNNCLECRNGYYFVLPLMRCVEST